MNLLPKRLGTLKRNAKKNIVPLLTPYLLKPVSYTHLRAHET